MPLRYRGVHHQLIDRTNIGMAKATMSVDIGLSATAFGLGAGLFFTYAVLEIPSNLFLTRIGARRWIAHHDHLGIISAHGVCHRAYVLLRDAPFARRRRSGALSGHYLLPDPLV